MIALSLIIALGSARADAPAFSITPFGSLTLSKPEVRGFAARMGPRSGLGGGAFVAMPVSAGVAGSAVGFELETGLLAMGRGFRAAGVDFYAPQFQVPLGVWAWVTALEGIRIGLGAGAHFNYPLTSLKDSDGNRYAYSDRDLNRLDPGVHAALGLTTLIGESYGFLFEARYDLSLLNVYSGDADASWRWHDFQLMVGLRLDFGGAGGGTDPAQ